MQRRIEHKLAFSLEMVILRSVSLGRSTVLFVDVSRPKLPLRLREGASGSALLRVCGFLPGAPLFPFATLCCWGLAMATLLPFF